MSTTRQKGNMQVLGYVMHEAQYNLATMFKDTVQEAFSHFPNENIEFVADQLGICCRTLYRIIIEWEIIVPKKISKEAKMKIELKKSLKKFA